jgi:hypothetical protein
METPTTLQKYISFQPPIKQLYENPMELWKNAKRIANYIEPTQS